MSSVRRILNRSQMRNVFALNRYYKTFPKRHAAQ